MNQKIKYHKWTFFLSIMGSIASLGFYAGVLRQVYREPDSQVIIQELEDENLLLKSQVKVLTKSLENAQ